MEFTEYNQEIQRHFSNLVKFPGVTKVDKKNKEIKKYDVLQFLIKNEVTD
jgi:hypothetical protein